MESLNIMIADDSSLATKQLREILEQLGHNVIYTAKTGFDALENYPRINPDLVTMDITMPDMDGLSATKEIIQRFPDARIIMVTSHRQEHAVLDAIRFGAKGYIIKPFNAERLKAAIDQVLAYTAQSGQQRILARMLANRTPEPLPAARVRADASVAVPVPEPEPEAAPRPTAKRILSEEEKKALLSLNANPA